MTTLRQRAFGRSGETVTALGMGGGFVGFSGFENATASIHRALDQGIRYFDTSVMYLSGASQPIFGSALAEAKERPFLATKVGYFQQARHFRSVEALHVQLRENLRLLRHSHVDLLQIHEADWDQWWTDRADLAPWELFDLQRDFDFASAPVVQFLHEAKSNGLCRYIGISGNNARHLGRLVEEIPELDSVLIAYNYHPLNVTAREHVLPAATAKEMAVLVAGVMTFTNTLPASWRTEGTYFGQYAEWQIEELKKLQHASGVPMPELCLRFVAADERISSLLFGAHHPGQINDNIASYLRGPLPADLHAEVERIASQYQ